MRGILADYNSVGYVALLLQRLQGKRWREIWTGLDPWFLTFAAVGVTADCSDAVLWLACQHYQVTLITNNRTARGPDSLEAAIHTLNTPASLPVFTLANPGRVVHDPVYRDRVAERLLEYLIDIDNYRGTGRLYLP